MSVFLTPAYGVSLSRGRSHTFLARLRVPSFPVSAGMVCAARGLQASPRHGARIILEIPRHDCADLQKALHKYDLPLSDVMVPRCVCKFFTEACVLVLVSKIFLLR